MPQIAPLDCGFCVKVYFSEKQPGCFEWEGGYFEEGERVIFGTSGRIGHILRVCEVGKNYVMFKVEDLSSVSEGDVKMQGMVASALPIGFQLSWAQRFVMHYL